MTARVALRCEAPDDDHCHNASTGRIEGRGINEFLPNDACEMFVGNLAGNAAGLLAFLQHHDALVVLLETCGLRRDAICCLLSAVCWSTGGQGEPHAALSVERELVFLLKWQNQLSCRNLLVKISGCAGFEHQGPDPGKFS